MAKRAKKSGPPKDVDADVPITAKSFLEGAFTYPKVAVYRAEQRLGSLLAGQDVMTQRQIRREHDALLASSRMMPSLLMNVEDEELRTLVATLGVGKVSRDTWPDITFITLVQRRCVQHVDVAEEVFRTCWPFRRTEAEAEFDVLQIKMADLPERPTLAKAQICADRLVNDFLATHMPKHAAGKQQIVDMGRLMQEALIPDGNSEECTTAGALRGRMIAIAGYVQDDPVSAEQVECMMAMKKGKLKMDVSIADLLQEPWWTQRCKDTWKVAATECKARPAIDSLIARLAASDAPSLADTQSAWAEIEEMIPRWKPPRMRDTGLDRLWHAMEKFLRSVSETLLASTEGPDWQAQAQELRARIMRFQQHVPRSLEKEMAGVASAMSAQDIANVLRNGLGLLHGMADAPFNGAHVTQLLEAFGPCAVAQLADSDIASIAEAVNRLIQDDDMSHAKVKLAKTWVQMLRSSTAGESAYARVAGGTAETLEAQLKKTTTALELEAAIASQISVESRAEVCKLMREWEESSQTAMVGGTVMQAKADAIGALATAWLKDAFAKQIAQGREALEKAVEALDRRSRGGKEQGESWKKALTAESTWAEVLREASYYWASSETPPVAMSKVLDQLFKDTATAQQEYEKTCGLARQSADAALAKRTDEVCGRARITHVECYFLEVLASNASAGTKSTKIQSRVASMTKHGISTDELLPQIWDRAAAAM